MTVARLLLVNAMLGQFITGFPARSFVVGIPTIASALHADIIGISWAIIAYQLAGISLSVVFGRLGDIHGRQLIYGTGFGIMAAMFGLGTLLGTALGSALLTTMFRYGTGLREDVTPDAQQAGPFVFAMNATFAVCLGLTAIALVVSLLRGPATPAPASQSP